MTQFGRGEAMPCEVCEAMCLDAVDGTLTAAEQAAFERHVAGCVTCAEQLEEAQRGAAWMEMLKGHRPEPPVEMLAKILASTSGAQAQPVASASPVPAAAPAFQAEPVVEWQKSFAPVRPGFFAVLKQKMASAFALDGAPAHFQPRIAMTAAMAFFSLALTMNMAGIRLGDLKPSTLHRTIADARANATRSFQNLRVVYQVESRLDDLRGINRDDSAGRDPGGPFGEGSAAPKPEQQSPRQEQPKQQAPPNGTSELRVPAKMEPVAAALQMQEGA